MAGILRGLFGRKRDGAPRDGAPRDGAPRDGAPAADAAADAPPPGSTLPGLRDFFVADHRACDEAWATLEELLEGDADLQSAWERYERAMLHHLAMEEEVLFPAFEEATGMTGGPTQVMRMEHDQMRAVIAQMADLLASGDRRGVLARGDTMLMLVQQHNMKEEGMLYPMAEQALAGRWAELAARMDAVSV